MSSPATSTGTPAATSARRSAGIEARPERTSTAISDQRDAVLEVGAAQQVGDVLGLGALGVEGEHLDPAGPERVSAALGLAERGERLGGDGAGDARSRRRSLREAGSSRAPKRRVVRSATTGAGAAVGAAGTAPGSRGCRARRRRGSA